MRLALLVVGIVCTIAAPCAELKTASVLQVRIERLVNSFPGKVGVAIRDIERGEEVTVNADHPFFMASVYKIPIMVRAFREADAGRLSLAQRVETKPQDQRFGSVMSAFAPGLKPTIRDLIILMITISDNAATDLVLQRVGTKQVTATMRELGLNDLRIDRSTDELGGDWLAAADPSLRGKAASIVMMQEPQRLNALTTEQLARADRSVLEDPRDHGTPRAINDLLVQIATNRAASANSCADMLAILQLQQLQARIPRYLDGFSVGNKTGTLGLQVNDAGLVTLSPHHHIAITVFTTRTSEAVMKDEAAERIGSIARTAVDYFIDVDAPR